MSTELVIASSNLEPKKQAAIAALLTQPTIAKAAQSIGVSEKTLWRWMQTPEFDQAYDQARNAALVQTVSLLHKATGAAVAALIRNLKCGTPSVEVRAAIGILDETYEAREILEVEFRLKAIEQILEETDIAGRRNMRR